ncbi:hypothetical protein [Thermococcus peptonophilus]|uniref:hypothetical protein n=1 Tax=Thermococcus peptonophilus TaxID=53952 RepID=UPI000B166AFB
MDVVTLVVLLVGIVVAVGISAFLVSRMMQSYTREIYQVLESTIVESRGGSTGSNGSRCGGRRK